MEIEGAVEAELRLLDPAVRGDAVKVDSLFAPDFSEIGQSGRLWTRDEAISALTLAPTALAPTAPERTGAVTARVVAPDLVLVSYETVAGSGLRIRRTSLWRETPGGWQIVFHQGTPIRTTAS